MSPGQFRMSLDTIAASAPRQVNVEMELPVLAFFGSAERIGGNEH
jgi:hypothetical protein